MRKLDGMEEDRMEGIRGKGKKRKKEKGRGVLSPPPAPAEDGIRFPGSAGLRKKIFHAILNAETFLFLEKAMAFPGPAHSVG